MTTEWTNTILRQADELNSSIGEVTTLSTWKIWDCNERKWSDKPPVQLRNILLAGMHPLPKERFCIGEIPVEITTSSGWKQPPHWSLLNPFTPPDSDKYYLDLASGSRNHGRFTFNPKTVGRWYFDEDWKRIIYGSILHTGCKRIRYGTFNIVVTDDTRKDKNGNLEDDGVNRVHWFTGDSHAKAFTVTSYQLPVTSYQ